MKDDTLRLLLKNQLGYLMAWDDEGAYGTICLDTSPTQTFHVHINAFSDADQRRVREGRFVRFDVPDGQLVGRGKKPRVSRARMME